MAGETDDLFTSKKVAQAYGTVKALRPTVSSSCSASQKLLVPVGITDIKGEECCTFLLEL